jgi:outer membrane protein assembly factor BamB
MISTERFLAILEERDLLPAGALAALWKQVAQSKKPIPAATVAKKLIDDGFLTPALAKRLLSAGEEEEGPKPKAGQPQTADEEEIGLAPLDDEPAHPRAKVKPKPQEGLAATPRGARKEPPQTEKPAAKPASAGSLWDEELPPLAGGFSGGMGPLDGLLAGGALDAGAMAGGSSLTPVAPRKKGLLRFFSRKKKPAKKKEDWGSSLMLIGGGGLLLLVILGGVLLWALTRGGGDEMFRLATEDYKAGSYAQAIHKYGLYLESYPRHSGASMARVRIGLAKLRQATADKGNWPAALQVANEVLGAIAGEPDFKEAHGELAGMLPAIADGLAADARKKPDQALVDQARQAIALIDKYVPKSLRPDGKLADVEASLALTVRDIARGTELDKAVAGILEAAKALKTQEAYQLCNALLRQYPELADNLKLNEALLAVSRAQQALVKAVQQPKPAESSDPLTAALSTVVLTQYATAAKVAGAEGQIALAAVDGAVYGLDPATGKVLWRRFVGFDANPQGVAFPPTPLSTDSGSDALLVDAAHNELLRVEGATGRLRWRQVIGEPFDAYPVVADDRILVAARSGKLIAVAAASGDSSGYTQLPQALRVAPAVDARRSLVLQVAEHTNLFVLSLADGKCRQVVHLGHQPGSVTTAPVLLGDYLLVAVNDGARDATLQVLAVQPDRTGKTGPAPKPVQQIRLKGRVQTPLLVDGRRLLVTTDQGTVRVFELVGLVGSDAKNPLREIGDTVREDAGNLARFALFQGGEFWIADKQLTKYEIQAARGRLVPKWICAQQSAFLQPPVAAGQTVVTVRRRIGRPGACVSAVAMPESEQQWETQLAVPLAGEPVVAGGDKVIAVTSAGAVFRVDVGKSGSKVIDEPGAPADASKLKKPLRCALQLSGGLLALAAEAGTDQIGILDPQSQPLRLRWFKTPNALACAPVAAAGGLLIPGKIGQVYLLDPDGKPLAEPFQPRLEAGVELNWRTPAAVGDKEAVLADGATKLYRLAVADQPKPHLVALAEATVAEPIVSPVAVVAETAYAVDGAGVLAAFELPKLTRAKQLTLSGRCVLGPIAVGGRVLLTTDDEKLLCMGAKGERLWQVALPYGPLAGTPLALGGHYLLASQSGVIWRIDAGSGKELGKVDLGLPLGTGVALLGDQLLVGGHDGTLYEVRQP